MTSETIAEIIRCTCPCERPGLLGYSRRRTCSCEDSGCWETSTTGGIPCASCECHAIPDGRRVVTYEEIRQP